MRALSTQARPIGPPQGWVYGFPELTPQQEDLYPCAKRVSNPGCYPTGALALISPWSMRDFCRVHMLDCECRVRLFGRRQGTDRALRKSRHARQGPGRARLACTGWNRSISICLKCACMGALDTNPIFLPSYSNAFYRGMLCTSNYAWRDVATGGEGVKSGIRRPGETIQRQSSPNARGKVCESRTSAHGAGARVSSFRRRTKQHQPSATARVLECGKRTVILTACLDNLGKGASGAAGQNVEMMLDL